MEIDDLRLDYLTDLYIEQELFLLDILLSQIPYAQKKSIEISLKDIPKEVFLKTTHDWHNRYIEILDRFFKLEIVSNYRGDIIVDVNEEKLIKYRDLLFKEQDRRKTTTNRVFCTLENDTFYLNSKENERPFAINFKTNGKINQVLDLMETMYLRWNQNYQSTGLTKCLIPKIVILSEMKKRGHLDFTSKQLADSKTYLKSKLDSQNEISKHVLISFETQSDSYSLEITPFSY